VSNQDSYILHKWLRCELIHPVLQGVSIASYVSPVLAIVGMSVCLSVTHWHWVKTTRARITKSSSTDSPRTSFRDKNSFRNSKGSPRARALNERVVKKIQKQSKIGPQLLLMTNGKSHAIRPFGWCQNQRPWILKGRYALHCRKDAYFGAHNKNLNEHRPILLAAEM